MLPKDYSFTGSLKCCWNRIYVMLLWWRAIEANAIEMNQFIKLCFPNLITFMFYYLFYRTIQLYLLQIQMIEYTKIWAHVIERNCSSIRNDNIYYNDACIISIALSKIIYLNVGPDIMVSPSKPHHSRVASQQHLRE